MTKRREFPKPVKVEIIRRATKENGVTYCEGCGLPTRNWEIDHIIADGFAINKSHKLTSSDGQLLCKDVCHAAKTPIDQTNIAKAKRREAAHIGATRPAGKIRSAGFAEPAEKDRTLTKIAAGMPGIARQFRTIIGASS